MFYKPLQISGAPVMVEGRAILYSEQRKRHLVDHGGCFKTPTPEEQAVISFVLNMGAEPTKDPSRWRTVGSLEVDDERVLV